MPRSRGFDKRLGGTRRGPFAAFLMLAVALAAVLLLASCGAGAVHRRSHARVAVHTTAHARPASIRGRAHRSSIRRVSPRAPEVLLTAPSENRLLVVRLPSGRVVRQVKISGEPEYVAEAGLLVVVRAESRSVTLLDPWSLRPVKTFHGFASPHIVAVSPDFDYAYVTDDATGRVTAIALYDQKVASSLKVGQSAHHLAFSPDARQVWIALGESATTVAILGSGIRQPGLPESSPAINFGHPHLVGRSDPGFRVHALEFSPNSKDVWLTSADTDYAGVVSARSHRLLFRVPVGAPPQHIAIAGRYAYLTSGYGSRIEQVGLSTGRVLRTAQAPYGSFELATTRRYVVTVSLLRGTLAIYNRQLRLLRIRRLASSLEDVIPFTP